MGKADLKEAIAPYLPSFGWKGTVDELLGVPRNEVLFWDDDQINIDGATEYGINAEFYADYPSFLATMQTKYNL